MILTLQNILDLTVLGHVILLHGFTDTEQSFLCTLLKHSMFSSQHFLSLTAFHSVNIYFGYCIWDAIFYLYSTFPVSYHSIPIERAMSLGLFLFYWIFCCWVFGSFFSQEHIAKESLFCFLAKHYVHWVCRSCVCRISIFMDIYVDTFDAVHVYLSIAFFFSSQLLFLDAAANKYISILSIFSAFQDDGFLGMFSSAFWIVGFLELLTTILHVLVWFLSHLPGSLQLYHLA